MADYELFAGEKFMNFLREWKRITTLLKNSGYDLDKIKIVKEQKNET